MDLVDLFEADSKKDLRRITSKITISKADLISLVRLSQESFDIFPYQHAFKRRENIPPDLNLTEMNLATLESGTSRELRKALNKLWQLPIASERAAAHLFYTPRHSYWHLFYFDTRDRASNNNHWVEGSHIHYLSHLCVNRRCQDVWTSFYKDGKKGLENSGFHIRFQP